MITFGLILLGIATYLSIGYGLSILAYTLYKLGYKNLALLDMRHDNTTEVLLFTFAWPLVLVAAPVATLVAKTLDFIINFCEYHNVITTWIDDKIIDYNDKKMKRSQVNPDIINKFKV